MSPDNRAVLPDYVLMEAFKPGRPDGVQGAFSILSRFPEQVVALKGTGEVSGLDPDHVEMAEAMISHEETEAFPSFCAAISAAGNGGQIDGQLALRAGWAREQMDLMLKGFADMAPAMDEFLAPFTAVELRLIRQEEPFTPAMSEKFFGLAASMANQIFELRPDLVMPSTARRPDHFVFRNSLCYAVYMMSRVRAGARNWKGAIARNDSIDVMLAAYSTYFDGVMSEDRLTNEVFHIGRSLLESTGTSTSGDYVADYMMSVVDYLEEHGGAPSVHTKSGASAESA
jgi:hypothetical protein